MVKTVMVGIDIDYNAVKVAVLIFTAKKVMIVESKKIPTTESLFSSNYQFNYQETVKKLQHLKINLSVSCQDAVISLPESAIIYRTLTQATDFTDEEIHYAVNELIANDPVVSSNEMTIDYVEDEKHSQTITNRLFHIYATPTTLVQERANVLNDAGFKPVAIVPERLGLLYIWDWVTRKTEEKSQYWLLHITSVKTVLCGWHRSAGVIYQRIPFGSDSMSALDEGLFYRQLSVKIQGQFQLLMPSISNDLPSGLWVCATESKPRFNVGLLSEQL